MCSNGNSFGMNSSSAGDSCGIQDPEASERLSDKLTWGWAGFQTLGNAL